MLGHGRSCIYGGVVSFGITFRKACDGQEALHGLHAASSLSLVRTQCNGWAAGRYTVKHQAAA